MSAISGGFDEAHDEPPSRLPPEDRIWRHPSELDPLALDPDARRRLRLLSHPSRRSALTAGLVGALLASGVAALVTHLADSIGAPPRPSVTSLASHKESGATTVSAALASKISHVSSAMATVEVTRADATSWLDGLVIRSNGMLLVPAFDVKGAQAIVVTLADGDVYVGALVGSDARSGLAVVRINGASGLNTVSFSKSPIANGSLALAVVSPGKQSFALATVVTSGPARRIAGHQMLGTMSSDISPADGRAGSALLAPSGTVEGVVIGFEGSTAVIAPAWLAKSVTDDLVASSRARRGWLGIRCVTNTGRPSGVRIVWMAANSSLAHIGGRVGEVIVAIDRTAVSSVAGLEARLYGLRPGTRVALTLSAEGALVTRTVQLAASPNG